MNELIDIICEQCGDEFRTSTGLVEAGEEGEVKMEEKPVQTLCKDCRRGEEGSGEIEGEEIDDQ